MHSVLVSFVSTLQNRVCDAFLIAAVDDNEGTVGHQSLGNPAANALARPGH
jgi:hypothetical protein